MHAFLDTHLDLLLALLLFVLISACTASDPSKKSTPEVLFPNGPPSASHDLLEFLSSEPSQAELKQRVESQPELFWDIYQKTLNADVKQSLHQALQIDRVRSADLILTGSYSRFQAIQGGVIDYHHVWVWFDKFQSLWSSPRVASGTIRDNSVRIGTGLHEDSSACAAPAKAIAAVKGERVWLLRLQSGNAKTVIFDVAHLPAQLAGVVVKLRTR